jgi:7-cyano-7-deazaguanine reductase
VLGKFFPRGGISIDPYSNYGIPGTKYEALAWTRIEYFGMDTGKELGN